MLTKVHRHPIDWVLSTKAHSYAINLATMKKTFDKQRKVPQHSVRVSIESFIHEHEVSWGLLADIFDQLTGKTMCGFHCQFITYTWAVSPVETFVTSANIKMNWPPISAPRTGFSFLTNLLSNTRLTSSHDNWLHSFCGPDS